MQLEEKIVELVKLTEALREKQEKLEKGLVTKAEFEELKEKIEKDYLEIKTALQRPETAAQDVDEEKAQKKAAFFKYLRGEILNREEKALVADSTGQILIPEELEAEVRMEKPKTAVIRPLATVRTIRSDRIRRRSLTDVSVSWGKLETGATLTESTPTPSEAYIYVEDLYALAKVGEDELMDTDIALESLLVQAFSNKTAEAEDTAFVAGTGHSNGQPEGILNGTTVTRVNAGQAGAITADDILRLIYEVPSQYRKNGVLIVNSSTELALMLLKDNNGQYLWQPALQAGRPNTFRGYPVYTQDDVPEIPAAGTAADVAIFGDLKSGYMVVDRLGMTVQRLTELYAESGLVGFKVHYRVGGGVVWPNALRILQVPAV
ncbi:phage major capsid protein [Atrimonas thermophila]|uniref:phage major capsid protein n=1 Tax=Atrimonas thermophila TaxID=3064161 RepID=UPI00399D4F84